MILLYYADFRLGRCKKVNQNTTDKIIREKKKQSILLLPSVAIFLIQLECPCPVFLPPAHDFPRLAVLFLDDPKVAGHFQDFILRTLLFKLARQVVDVFLLDFNLWHRCIKQSKTPETSVL